jgi:tetratricopeptide (TPR) repeat protein
MIHQRSSFGVATLLAVALAVAAAVVARPAVAAGDADDLDLKARKLFAAGDYRQALDIYVNLYAETLHPTFLRNIGRCQQNLGEADKAIASFREYLRKAKDLTAAQRQEIDGYIAEMEEMKRRQAGGGGAATATPAAELRASPATASPARPALISTPAEPARASDDDGGSPIYARAWFWVAIGAVTAGAVTAFLLLRDDGGKGPLDTLDLRGGMTP